MAGRRLRQTGAQLQRPCFRRTDDRVSIVAVLDTLVKAGFATADTHVVISGLSNQYSHYVTTREEYGAQRYEGASTMFGPFTLAAYQQRFAALALALATGAAVAPGPTPNDYRRVLISLFLLFLSLIFCLCLFRRSKFAFDVMPPVVADR